jgi:hypothetical protein
MGDQPAYISARSAFQLTYLAYSLVSGFAFPHSSCSAAIHLEMSSETATTKGSLVHGSKWPRVQITDKRRYRQYATTGDQLHKARSS